MENTEFRQEVQNKAIKILLNSDRAGVNISMRLGKTKIGLETAQKFKKVLVSYPFESVKSAWISDSKEFNLPIEHITFTTNLSLYNEDLNLYDAIILDEYQLISINLWEYIDGFKPKVVKGLSGTPPKGEKASFVNKYCPILYTVTLDETSGITSKDYEIVVHLLSPSNENNILLKSGKKWSEKAKIQFWENKYKQSRSFQDMLRIIQSIQNSDTKLNYFKTLASKIDRGLLFLETTKQCDEIGYPVYHSKSKQSEINLELFQNGEIDKIATISQLSVGKTFKNLKECIILHCYASTNKSQQKLGRVLNYVEGEKALIHILCLNNTRDLQWTQKALEDLDQSKITWKNI